MDPILQKVIDSYSDQSGDKPGFLKSIGHYHPPDSGGYIMIDRGYTLVEKEFESKMRQTGERYFAHLRAVARSLIVHTRVIDPEVITTALLHDIIEDLPDWNYERVKNLFGVRVATMVWYLTELDPNDFGGSKVRATSHYHLRLFEIPSEFIGVIRVKLTDRLHNMLTIWSMEPRKIRQKLVETVFV